MVNKTVAKVVVAAFAVSLIVLAGDIVLLLFAAILMAVMLRALSQPAAKYLRISPGWALAIVVTALVLLLAIIGWLIAPAIGRQLGELRAALPAALQRLQLELSRFAWLESFLDSLHFGNSAPAQPELASKVTGALSETVKALAHIVFVLIVALYLAADPRPYVEGTVRLFPLARRERAREVLHAIGDTLRWWLLGKAASMLIIGSATFVGLAMLGVPLAAVLALITGLLEFIPNIGPILSLFPAALFALLQGPTQVFYVVLLYAAIQTVESYLLTPLIEQRTVSLPPALTLTVMLGAALLFGTLGLLLAAPATAALLVLVKMVYLEDMLGERNAR